MRHEIAIHESPSQTIRLQLTAPADLQSPHELAGLALEAVFAVADGLCDLLSAELWLAYCDAETAYPLSSPLPSQPFWLLQQHSLPPLVVVKPTWQPLVQSSTDQITLLALLDWLDQALAQPCTAPAATLLSWRELSFQTTRVRLPDQLTGLSGDSFSVRADTGVLEHPLERKGDGNWVAGPLAHKTLTAPITLRVTNEAGRFTLDIDLYWSLWSTTDAPGHRQLESVLSQLHRLGWEAA